VLLETSISQQAALQETVDIRLWLVRCRDAGVPVVPAFVCPIAIPSDSILNGCISPRIAEIGEWTEKTTREIAASTGKAMWRWSHCAPIEIKAAMAKPGIPIRLPWPPESVNDERLLAILAECRESRLSTVTTVVRPWVDAAIEADYPVEFRVFVTSSGRTSTTSYYAQRALGDKWIPYAKKAAEMARLLRRYVTAGVEFSADFLVTATKEVLFLEGGPSPEYGADPCCFSPTHIFGDDRIALQKEC